MLLMLLMLQAVSAVWTLATAVWVFIGVFFCRAFPARHALRTGFWALVRVRETRFAFLFFFPSLFCLGRHIIRHQTCLDSCHSLYSSNMSAPFFEHKSEYT